MTSPTTAKTLLTQPAELEAPKAIAGMLYGQPGAFKTTTALSAPNTVLLDFDRGLHRVKPEYRRPSLQVENYDQVLELIDGEELAPYDTIAVDTGGKLVDSIIAYCIRKNPKDGNGRGAPSQQGWGSVKSEFAAFVKRLKASGKSVIFVAHESEEKNGDETIKRPDIAGSARKDVVKELDFMGYMELRGDQPVINFNPTDKFYAKNSLDLPAAIEVPRLKPGQPNNFLSHVVFKASETKVAAENALRKEYDDLRFEIDAVVGGLKTLEDVNQFYSDGLPKLREIWDSTFYAKHLLKQKVEALGLEFDRDAKAFKKKPTPKEEKTAAKADDKAAKKAAAGESAPAGQQQAQVASASAQAEPAGAGRKKAEITDDSFSQ